MTPDPRTVVWFSAGAASAVAAKITLSTPPTPTVVYCDPGSEHPDNYRFITDCEAWFDRPVDISAPPNTVDTWQVWDERRFLNGPTGALCTVELKKKPRYAFQRPDDIQVFGYTAEEAHRAARFRDENPGIDLVCPLIERGLTHADCLAIVDRAGIELPVMYRLGFGQQQLRRLRQGRHGLLEPDPPTLPRRRSTGWRSSNATSATPALRRIRPGLARQLDPDRGEHNEPSIECSLLCALAEQEWDSDTRS